MDTAKLVGNKSNESMLWLTSMYTCTLLQLSVLYMDTNIYIIAVSTEFRAFLENDLKTCLGTRLQNGHKKTQKKEVEEMKKEEPQAQKNKKSEKYMFTAR